MPSALKKSSSGVSFPRGTLKCAATRLKISSRVLSVVGIQRFASPITNYQLRQVRLHALILHKLAQPFLHRRLRKQLTEDFDLAFQLFIRDRLHEFLSRNRSPSVEFAHLRRRGTRQTKRLPLRRNLTDQPNLLRLHPIEPPSRQKQVSPHWLPQIPLHPR